jgi:hypothetical protein
LSRRWEMNSGTSTFASQEVSCVPSRNFIAAVAR